MEGEVREVAGSVDRWYRDGEVGGGVEKEEGESKKVK